MNERLPTSVELLQAKICVRDLGEALAQAEIVEIVQKLAGVQSVQIAGGELHVVYDPLQVSEKEIERAIGAGGHPTCGGEAERDSPFA
jgi:hypothetical protein